MSTSFPGESPSNNQQMQAAPTASAAPFPGYTPTADTPRKTENLVLNILLYVASLLVIGSAAIFITSVAPALLRVILLAVGTLLFYGAGLSIYRYVPKLRLASYSFTATGLALVPLTGLAVYTLLWQDGPLVWIATSIIGTILVLVGTTLMQERVMAYLLISFLISDVLSASKVLQLSMIWYFVGLLVLATLLALFTRFWRTPLPQKLQAGFLDASRFFVPGTMFASLFFGHQLSLWELALIFGLATLYCLAFMTRPIDIWLYLQARLYSLISVITLTVVVQQESSQDLLWAYLPSLVLVAVLLVTAVLLVFFDPQLPWPPRIDAYITWACSLGSSIYTLVILTEAFYYHAAYVSAPALGSLLPLGMFPVLDSGIFLPPLWAILILPILALLPLLKKLTAPEFYLGLGLPLLVAALMLHTGLLSIVLLGASVLSLVRSKLVPSKPLEFALSSISLVSSLLLLGLTLIKTPIPFNYLLLALLGAALLLALFINAEKLSIKDTHFNTILWVTNVLVALTLYHALQSAAVSFGQDSDTPARVILDPLGISFILAFTLPIFAYFLALWMTWKKPLSTSLKYQLLVSFCLLSAGFVLLAAANLSLWPHLLFNLFIAIFYCLGMVRLVPDHRALMSGLLRGVLLYSVLISNQSLKLDSTYYLVAFICCLVLSLISLYLYKRYSTGIEFFLGLTFALVSPLLNFPLIVRYQEVDLANALMVLLLLLLLAWVFLVPHPATKISFSLYLPVTLLLLSSAYYPDPQDFTAWGASICLPLALSLLIVKGVSVLLPVSKNRQLEPDPYQRFGHRYNSSIIFPSLLITSPYLLLFYFVHYSITYVFTFILFFFILGLQVRPSNRITIWVLGGLFFFVKLLDIETSYSVYLAVLEIAALVLLVRVLTNRQRSLSSSLPFLWISFSIQVIATVSNLSYPWVSPLHNFSLILVTVLLITSAALHKAKSVLISSAFLLTVQVFQLSGGLSPLSLFLLGLALIGLVIWRLLSRKEELPPAQPLQQYQPQSGFGTALQDFPSQPSGHNQPVSNTWIAEPDTQTSASENKPWAPPSNRDIKPWSS